MRRVLFLCIGNSCRSQMAEGWARHFLGEDIDVYSAGTSPHGIDPRAVAVMVEAGIDISAHRSKHMDKLRDISFDLVVTVCDSAQEECPVFSGAVKTVNHSFDDPPLLSGDAKSEDEALDIYRRVRDEIRDFVASTFPDFL